MKKLLLLIILCFSTSNLIAQFTQPSQFNNVCDDNSDGFTTFFLGEINFEIIGNLNYQDYTITHHETQTDAQTGANPLSSTYNNISAFTQEVYARIVTNANGQVTIFPYTLYANPAPMIPFNLTLTGCVVNGMQECVDLNSLTNEILLGQTGVFVSFHETQFDAFNGTAPISNPNCYQSLMPGSQVLYYRSQDQMTGCYSVGTITLFFQDCSPCPAPGNITISQVTDNSAAISWTSSGGSSTPNSWAITVQQYGAPVLNISTTANPYLLSGLACGTVYDITVTAICNEGASTTIENWFQTTACVPGAGQPTSQVLCANENGLACFNLTVNTPLILNGLSPSEYTVTYHASMVDANAGVSAIVPATSYCVGSDFVVFSRIENNVTHAFQLNSFNLFVDTMAVEPTPLSAMDQCDENGDSLVIFNLTNIVGQIPSGNTLTYYNTLADAQNQTSPIANPTSFTVALGAPFSNIFVREDRINTCDGIYTFMVRTQAECSQSYTCGTANSLCNSLGLAFANTTGVPNSETGNYYGCLNSQPNPTWFYLPVSENGTINLKIEQNSFIGFNGQALDVDYIAYGPFTNPVTPCSGQLTQANMVSCSYSSNAIEYPVIANAQAGQYYIIMVTNFSNQAGYIRITELSNTVGAIDCSGVRLNAFLDSNNNGNQDSGERNFPLGQFAYELNSNGAVHNIISPSGVYNIYDGNVANSYNLSYTIDSNYATLYNVAPASYSNVHVAGIGMTVYNFPVTVVQSYTDLAVNITPLTAPRPGFTYQNIVSYTNNGNQTVASGTVTFNTNVMITITGNSQAGTTPTATGFTYAFTNLLPFETRSITVTMQVPTIPIVSINDLLTNTATVGPTAGDVVLSNNSFSSTQIIIGSYDPNDKMESHGEKILHSAFTANDYLYYTIRFENTGTASAVNVRVNDILDPKLDETSLKMVSSSHAYVLDRLDNALNWKFENIELPPSVANTTIGKGYVMFRIKPKAGYAVGDIIPNTASIYFDFNPAIVTNTVNTEFVQQLGVNEFGNADFAFYPNPVSDIVNIKLKGEGTIAKIEVYDLMGKMILSQKPNASVPTQTVDLSSVSKGMYLLEVTTDTNIKVAKKLLIK